jgi:FeS assembly protein SufD
MKMNRINTDKLNVLPAPTYRWLKVNELTIDEPINFAVKPYRKEFLQGGNHDGFTLMRMSDEALLAAKKTDRLNSSENYGVSKNLVAVGEDFFNSGVYLNIPEGVVITEPIVMKYELDDENDTVIDNNIIIADRNSRVTVIIDISSSKDVSALHNGVTKVIARDGAEVTIVKLQRMNNQSYHFDSNVAVVDGAASVRYIEAEFGCKKAVVNYTNKLGEAAKAHIDAVYLGDHDRHIDLSYLMEHLGRRSVSNIVVRGALKDKASKVFKGTIDFKKGAGQSDGKEEEFVILFDKTVKSKSVPLLLCSEDDVKGQHAASAGKVDRDKLFYLMSRGFSKEEAMKLLVEASFSCIIEKIPIEELRTAIGDEIHRRLVYEG